MSRNYYDILNVDKDASADDIKHAWRRSVRKYHPDNGGNEEKFKEAAEAYEVLSDPVQRQSYDCGGTKVLSGVNFHNPFDFMRDHGIHFSRHKPGVPIPERGQHKFLDLKLTLEELVQNDITKNVTYLRCNRCRVCNNTGLKTGRNYSSCNKCNGSGQFVQISSFGNRTVHNITTCPVCLGSGICIPDEDKCDKCNGQGWTEENKTLSVKIPRLINYGNRIVLPGQGNCGMNGGPNGDVVIYTKIEEHAVFTVVDFVHLAMSYTINFVKAAIGCTIEIPTVHKKIIKLKIPPGTQSNEIFSIKGYGCPSHDGTNGNLYVNIKVCTPSNLDEKQKATLLDIEKDLCHKKIDDNNVICSYIKELEQDK